MPDLRSRGGSACSNKIRTPQDSNWISSWRKGLININENIVLHYQICVQKCTSQWPHRNRKDIVNWQNRLFPHSENYEFPSVLCKWGASDIVSGCQTVTHEAACVSGACNNTFAQTVIQASYINSAATFVIPAEYVYLRPSVNKGKVNLKWSQSRAQFCTESYKVSVRADIMFITG